MDEVAACVSNMAIGAHSKPSYVVFEAGPCPPQRGSIRVYNRPGYTGFTSCSNQNVEMLRYQDGVKVFLGSGP